jgi:hypothetical protein
MDSGGGFILQGGIHFTSMMKFLIPPVGLAKMQDQDMSPAIPRPDYYIRNLVPGTRDNSTSAKNSYNISTV